MILLIKPAFCIIIIIIINIKREEALQLSVALAREHGRGEVGRLRNIHAQELAEKVLH
jgi:hypothetical protein